MSPTIAHWEAAFSGYDALDDEEWGEILRVADPKTWHELGEDAPGNAMSEFQDVAEHWRMGQIVLDFPLSTHGDGCSVTIYCLPAGTVVFTKFSTTEFDGPNGKVTRLASFGSVAWRASELLWDGLEGMDAPVQNLDEDEEYDPDSQVTLSGEADLWRQWSRKVIERFWYLGQSRRIRLHTGPLKAAKFRGGWLHVSAPGGIDQYGQLREAVRDWLEGRARQRLPDVVAACRDRIKLPVPPVDITDDWKSWARSPDGRLVVGWRLVQAHPTVAEYVITRELIRLHSRQRGFDPSVRLTRALPDHLNRRETLRHFRENLDDWGF